MAESSFEVASTELNASLTVLENVSFPFTATKDGIISTYCNSKGGQNYAGITEKLNGANTGYNISGSTNGTNFTITGIVREGYSYTIDTSNLNSTTTNVMYLRH